MAAEMVTFGVTIGAIQTVLRKYEVIGTLETEFGQFCDVLRSTKVVLENVERSIGPDASANSQGSYFGAIKQIHAAIKQGEEAIDDCAKTRKVVVNFFSDNYLSSVRAASKKLQLALSSAAFSGVAGIQQVNENVEKFEKTVSTHHSQVMETMKNHSNRLDQLHLLMQAQLVKDKEEFAEMLHEAADKAEQFYRCNKPLIDENMYEWIVEMSKESNIDDQLICPISKDVMEDPVLLIATGNSYDRKSLCQSLLSYPNLDPASGVEFGEPLKYVDNVVVRSILIDKGRYKKHDDTMFLKDYPIAFKKKMEHLGFGGQAHQVNVVQNIDTTAHDESETADEEGGQVTRSTTEEESKQSGDNCSIDFAKSRPLIVSMTIIIVLVILFVALRFSGGDGNSPSELTDDAPKESSSGETSSTEPANSPADSSNASSFVDFINSISLSGQSFQYPISEGPTPEEKALAWLIEADPLRLDPTIDTARIQQRYSLLTFWFHTKPVLKSGESWLTVAEECSWEGIESCTDDDSSFREVTAHDMHDTSLSGVVPPDIGLLTKLSVLRLDSNDLIGEIPSSLASLTLLEELRFQFNSLNGKIPSSFSQLTKLGMLDLAYNKMTGSIPLWLSELSDLTFLDFAFNEFEGSIPGLPLSELTSLTYLALNGNSLSGTIPSELSLLSALTWVAFSSNPALEGTIPSELSSWSNLFESFFYGTNLNGTMPLCSLSNESRVHLVGDCLAIDCPCCTHCCPTEHNGIPVFEYC